MPILFLLLLRLLAAINHFDLNLSCASCAFSRPIILFSVPILFLLLLRLLAAINHFDLNLSCASCAFLRLLNLFLSFIFESFVPSCGYSFRQHIFPYLKLRSSEVDKNAMLNLTRSQITQKLSSVLWRQTLTGFQFDYDFGFHE